MSTDFGLKEFNVKSPKERIRRYRRYVYQAGAINRKRWGRSCRTCIDNSIVTGKLFLGATLQFLHELPTSIEGIIIRGSMWIVAYQSCLGMKIWPDTSHAAQAPTLRVRASFYQEHMTYHRKAGQVEYKSTDRAPTRYPTSSNLSRSSRSNDRN